MKYFDGFSPQKLHFNRKFEADVKQAEKRLRSCYVSKVHCLLPPVFSVPFLFIYLKTDFFLVKRAAARLLLSERTFVPAAFFRVARSEGEKKLSHLNRREEYLLIDASYETRLLVFGRN